ncbi:MAG: 30S ribosomal protein S24e [Thermoplasmata archaeon]|nr:MAG: 30S ribosomal protein S24e [Thermoplasmata archaeon]
MEIEFENRRENKILGREEIFFKVKYEGKTPSREKVREQLKNMLGGKGVVVIEYIKTLYGIPEARGYAKVYASEEQAKEIEEKHIIERNFGKKKGKEEKKETKEEKEEKKEDVMEEEKEDENE